MGRSQILIHVGYAHIPLFHTASSWLVCYRRIIWSRPQIERHMHRIRLATCRLAIFLG